MKIETGGQNFAMIDLYIIEGVICIESVWSTLEKAKADVERQHKAKLTWKWVVRKQRWEGRIDPNHRQPDACIYRRVLDAMFLSQREIDEMEAAKESSWPRGSSS